MSIRSRIANAFIGFGRRIGRGAGAEMMVELGDHRIDARMVHPDSQEEKAWDDNLYRRGNVFVRGYANPIKPAVNAREDLDDPDTIDVREAGENEHMQLISSPRYHKFMQQDLIDSLLTPQEKWQKLMYVILGVGALVLINFGMNAYASGLV